MTATLLIRRGEVRSSVVGDLRIADGRIQQVADRLERRPGECTVDADGGALLPGLHDHHVHLLAQAASARSVRCGPPSITSRTELAELLGKAAPVDGWVRGVGYHERVAGFLDRHVLDAMRADAPLRVQHRSGALWILNTAGLAKAGIDTGQGLPSGVELDDDDLPTGRLWRLDDWLGERLGTSHAAPDLAALGRQLAALGVTGVTDATPDLTPATIQLLVEAVHDGDLPQRLVLLGADSSDDPSVQIGPGKLVLADYELPSLAALVDRIADLRRGGPSGRRPVAAHCVTRVALLLFLAALDEVGSVSGDRIEHAAVVPVEALRHIRRLGLTVVTQPGLVGERGDDYLREVEVEERADLYRYRTLLEAGIPVALSTDAPYTDLSPWRAIRAAVWRRTSSGAVVGGRERVSADVALGGFLGSPHDPGGPPRRVLEGAPADLCLLDRPREALRSLDELPDVVMTVIAGRIVHGGPGG